MAGSAAGPVASKIQFTGEVGAEEGGVARTNPSGYVTLCLQNQVADYCGLEAESIKAATLDFSLVRSSSRRYIM